METKSVAIFIKDIYNYNIIKRVQKKIVPTFIFYRNFSWSDQLIFKGKVVLLGGVSEEEAHNVISQRVKSIDENAKIKTRWYETENKYEEEKKYKEFGEIDYW